MRFPQNSHLTELEGNKLIFLSKEELLLEHLLSLLAPFRKTFKLIMYKKINIPFAFEPDRMSCSAQNVVKDSIFHYRFSWHSSVFLSL